MIRSGHRRCSLRKGVLRSFAKFTGKHLCQRLFLIKFQACNFIKKESLAQVFSYEFCEISKNTFTEHLWATASEYYSGKTGGVSRVTFRNGEGPPELCDNLWLNFRLLFSKPLIVACLCISSLRVSIGDLTDLTDPLWFLLSTGDSLK